jgi:hypothetical protein
MAITIYETNMLNRTSGLSDARFWTLKIFGPVINYVPFSLITHIPSKKIFVLGKPA